jgi:hypothetical protein
MVMQPDIDHTDPAIARAVAFMLSHRQPDGGIYDRILANYNTAISVSALSRIGTPEAASAVRAGIDFLRTLQWSEEAIEHPETGRVDRDHAFYGGVGYGGSSRPDMSNLTLFLQAFHDAGVDCNDPAIQRALVFLQRTQMLDSVNDMDYARGSQQGGFIYATSPNGQNIGVGESKAGMIEETLTTGERVSRLRAYGSMTYAGFKSMIFADLDRDDERVQAAYAWLQENYTVQENPGLGYDGYYYYLVTKSRALDAWGLPVIGTREEFTGSFDFGQHRFQSPGQTISIHANELRSGDGTTIRLTDSIGTAWFRFEEGEDGKRLAAYGRLGGPEVGQGGRLADGRRYTVLEYLGDRGRAIGNIPEDAEKWPDSVDGGAVGVRIEIMDDRDWANDLIARLGDLQNEDGSFRSLDDRWMEGNPVLITAYTVLALQHALR